MKVEIKVKTGAKKNSVVAGKPLIVETTAQPHDGAANNKIIEILADHYKIAKSQIKILHGLTNSCKVVEINTDIC